MANVDVIRQLDEKFLSGELDAMGEHYDPEIIWRGVDPQFEVSGVEEVLELIRQSHEADPATALVEAYEYGDWVVMAVRHQGNVLWSVMTFRDGLLLMQDMYPSREDAFAAVPAP